MLAYTSYNIKYGQLIADEKCVGGGWRFGVMGPPRRRMQKNFVTFNNENELLFYANEQEWSYLFHYFA